MPKEVPLCEEEITEEYFQRLKSMLEGFSIQPVEALITHEVYTSRRSHVGVDLISKKLPKNTFLEKDVDRIVKDLAHPDREILEIYP